MTILDNSVVPKWNEEPSTLDAFEERVILYVLGTKKEERYLCGPRLLAQMDPERQPCRFVKSAVSTTQLAAEGGATLVIAALRRALGARPIQEAVRLFRQLMGLRDKRRQPGESMRKWTSHFEAFIKKTGKALHPLIQGILLLECSNLSPAEMQPSWQRVERQQRKEAPLETVICMLIWPQVSLLSGTMRTPQRQMMTMTTSPPLPASKLQPSRPQTCDLYTRAPLGPEAPSLNQHALELEELFEDRGVCSDRSVCSDTSANSLNLERVVCAQRALLHLPPTALQLTNRQRGVQFLFDEFAPQAVHLTQTWSNEVTDYFEYDDFPAMVVAVNIYVKLH